MNFPQIDVDDLAAIIRESMAAQQHDNKQNGPSITAAPNVATQNSAPQLKLQPDFQPRAGDRYHVNDLLCYHDRAFVHAAYRAILKRAPNEAEFLRDLQKLQRGHVNKIDLLAELRYSTEGKTKKVELEGLTLPALIRRLGQLPLIGYPMRLGIALLRLPNLIRDQREFSGYVLSQNQQLADFINTISARVTESSDGLLRLAETLSAEQQATKRQQEELAGVRVKLDFLDQQLDEANKKLVALESHFETRMTAERQDLAAHLAQALAEQRQLLAAEVARLYLELQHTRAELTVQRAGIEALVAPRTGELSAPRAASSLDALYAALEDRFRGTREEIKARFQLYLPYVQDAAPVLDLGCGRGEWLEILQEAGIEARGVDLNRVQIDRCRALGLNVHEDDFLVYLRRLADESIGAVTGFHIIEHVSLETLIALLNETMRVLRPGGAVIFETPNPENVLVGSNYFYLDPTHRHPLPSELMQFLLESRGFHDLQVLKLHPWESARVAGDNELAQRFNDFFYGPMDYAIIGRKVGA